VQRDTILHQLLDDIPVATLVSGSVFARNGRHLPHHEAPHRLPPVGTCAGWAPGAVMTEAAARGGRPSFIGDGPPAAPLDQTDPLAWHALERLPPTSYRRLRLLDASPAADATIAVAAWFRDTYVEPDGVESVVHEYSLDLSVGREDLTVRAIEVVAHVLPGPDCATARASVARVVGVPLPEIRGHVSEQLVGTTTCTHLNDMVRSLGGLVAGVRAELGS
jgi:hypothetical protein